jgi:hypothetical protein
MNDRRSPSFLRGHGTGIPCPFCSEPLLLLRE